MLLDKPGRFFYKRHVDMYPAMRAFSIDYRYFVAGVVIALAAVLVWLLTGPDTLDFLGIT